MLASYRGSDEWTMHCTVALGYCLNRCALSESIPLRELLKSKYYLKLSWVGSREAACHVSTKQLKRGVVAESATRTCGGTYGAESEGNAQKRIDN